MFVDDDGAWAFLSAEKTSHQEDTHTFFKFESLSVVSTIYDGHEATAVTVGVFGAATKS